MRRSSNVDIFLQNNSRYLKWLRRSRKRRIIFRLHPRLRRLYDVYVSKTDPEEKNAACAAVLNAYETCFAWRAGKWLFSFREDLGVFFRQFGKRMTIDHSDRKSRDYYSVAVIVKNEARFIREFVLFYQSTGADRIYLYDNDSDDNLLEELEPFLKSGLFVYRKWPGHTVQTAAYRDAVRRTRRRTRWLALVDADEFLFSPRKSMPDQLREYEQYPGIGVNWLMFGPNGHVTRPEGLVMESYTTTLKDQDSLMNCHIKSIVRPAETCCITHTHYAFYRRGRFAVNECGREIDNYCSYMEGMGRAFTEVNHREVFRINHYCTKSLEDLKVKCARGYPDGSPNAVFEKQLRPFKEEQTEDRAIKPYEEIVRSIY